MHAFTRTRWTALTALMALSFVVSIAATAWGKPAPDYRGRGFRLFARSASAIGGNRVSCGILSNGQVCTDSTGSSTAGGGFWPRGSLNQYVFNSGLQIAGVFGPDAPSQWAETRDGAFFFNARGGGNGTEVTQIWRSSDADDVANWPEAARVPEGDATADLYAPTLQGKLKASDQDVWFMSWEGDPAQLGGRQHPLGIAVEARGMAFSSAGKEDFIFFVYTFYNVTCAQASCYAAARPAIQDTLLSLGQRFQSLNNAKFGVTEPPGGYSLDSLFVAFGADNDVTVEESGSNYDGVNVPFSMGYTYLESFAQEPSWKFDPQIYHAPFFAGAGFIGVKYLKSPVLNGSEVGLTLFGATTNGGQFSDPRDTKALYRYLSGTNSASTGDDECNVGDVKVTKICFINQGSSADMRFFQASGGPSFSLAPGAFSSIVVAYIFSAPVKSGLCPSAGCGSVQPQVPTGSLTRMNSVDTISNPALCCNSVDTMTGYNGFAGDTNGNGKVDQSELITIPGSLLGKAITAQAVFNAKFSQPLPPDAPTFYTIPGSNQVTILWQQSATEIAGDPYYATSQTPLQYDPNYRQFDVMGYRVYRNRNGDPSQMTLLAQYNYTDKIFTDNTGQVNGADESGGFAGGDEWGCWAPLGIFNTCTDAGSVFGVATIAPIDHNIAGEGLVQATSAVALLDGNVQIIGADTAITGGTNKLVCGVPGTIAPPCPSLDAAGGVPFVYTDNTAKNNLTYYYTVTAFDANSIRSGPSSLESARVLAKAVPSVPNSNVQSSGSTTVAGLFGRNVNVATLTPAAPTLDPTTGQFSGRAQPAPMPDMISGGFAGQFLAPLFQGNGSFDLLLTGLTLGDARNGVPVTYTYHGVSNGDTVAFSGTVVVNQQLDGSTATGSTPPFPAVHVNATQAGLLGVSPNFLAPAEVTQGLTSYQITNSEGRGCLDGGVTVPAGYSCVQWGPRWFQGANESTANPNAGTGTAGTNAGSLPGIATIQWPSADANMNDNWRNIDAALGGAIRATDFNVYWGAAGHVDSVIDLTYNVPVPFDSLVQGGGWAILTQASTSAAGSYDGRPGVLTYGDFGCLAPFWDGTDPGPSGRIPCGTAVPYVGQSTAVAGTIALGLGSQTSLQTRAPQPNPGFGMSIAGEWFMFELAPAASVPSNTVWTLRSYIGSIFNSDADNSYLFQPGDRTMSAIGAALRINYTAFNGIVTPTNTQDNVANVHTVPDPYYVTSQLERTTDVKEIKFVNLPANATIRIYTTSGVLVQILEHTGKTGGTETWGVRNRNGQFVASGVYFYSVEDANTGARKIGRMTIIQYAR